MPSRRLRFLMPTIRIAIGRVVGRSLQFTAAVQEYPPIDVIGNGHRVSDGYLRIHQAACNRVAQTLRVINRQDARLVALSRKLPNLTASISLGRTLAVRRRC